jgi:hypothetical protein
MQQRNSTVTKACALLGLLLAGSAVGAEPVGKVSDASGPLLARTAGGSIKVLAVGSDVEQGETLFTREGTYARVSLSDQSSVALGPDTELSIEKYSFHAVSEDSTDGASLKLAKGRVRISSGVLGTRHSNHFTLAAGITTIDVQHSTFVAEYVQPTSGEVAWRGRESREDLAISDSGPTVVASPRVIALTTGHAAGVYQNVSLQLAQISVPSSPTTSSNLNPGLYVQVLDGMINVTNGGGTQNFTAGQFGYTPSFTQPPVILPSNPGIQFTPPPSFSATSSQSNTSSSNPGDVDCIVR